MASNLQRHFLNLVYGKPREPLGDFNPTKIRKVLVVRRNGIGDMICTLPLLRSIKNAWPQVQIDMLAGERNACILENTGLVKNVFIYKQGEGIYRNHYINLPKIVRPIREEKHDLVIVVKVGFSSLLGIIAYATHIPWRLGFVPTQGRPLDFCFNLQVQHEQWQEHQIESCLRLLKPLGIKEASTDLSFPLANEHENYAKEIIKQTAFALFNVSSERYESRWTPEAIAETAKGLKSKFGLEMVLCGLAKDHEFIEKTQALAPNAIKTVVNPPTIHHFAALVRQSRFLMCGDGGPMHVAAAMKKPVFVLFSATNPEIWKPYSVPFAYVQQGRFVHDITSQQAMSQLEKWVPTLGTN